MAVSKSQLLVQFALHLYIVPYRKSKIWIQMFSLAYIQVMVRNRQGTTKPHDLYHLYTGFGVAWHMHINKNSHHFDVRNGWENNLFAYSIITSYHILTQVLRLGQKEGIEFELVS